MNNNATPLKNYFDEQVPQGELYTDDTSLLDTAVPLPPVVDKFGYWYPNDMNNCATAFNSGLYAQSAYGLVARNGDVLRIGVKGVSNQGGGSWPIWDNFRLIYRGFKPEVVQPVLEQAISDCDNLKSYLMGKTEYAALTKAFADAAKAIEENDGEAMFNALNALYDAKDPALLSKDLFLDQEVPADTVRLAEAIADVAGEKLSKATLQEAQTLLAAIKGNTKYEGTEIDQLKSDVTAAINAINSSVATYASLNEAIVAVKESVAKKAYQTLIGEASEQLTVAEAGYETGSLTDAQAKAQTEALWSKQNELTASIEAYANLAAAITRLQNAVTEASAETQHVAQSTLRKANLRLTASQKLYDEGTIATADIEARVKTIDELITELTRSIELYKQFAAGLEKLAAALEQGDKVSTQTLESATQLYTTAKQAYDEGTTDDDAVEATVKELEAATASLTASAALYKSLANAIPSLEEAVTQKAYQPLLDEATQLLTSVKDGYENASIEDANVNTTIENINAKVEAVNASATEYAKLKAAIDRLIAAIEEVGETATKSSLKKANLRLTASQRLYDEGTIADADIEARVTSIDELIESLTVSVRLRQQYDAAIASLDAAVDGAQGNVGEAMMQSAQALQTTIKADYAEGNVSDENVPAEIAKIENIVTALEAAHDAYQLASQKQQEIAEAEAAMADALSAIDTAETDANEAHLTGAYLEQATAAIADGRQGLGQLQAQLASLKDKTNNLLISLNGVTLTEGDTPVNSIKEELAAVDASAIATSATELATATVATVMACIPTAVAYDEADDNLPYISDTDLANVTITRTIKEGFNTVVLPFSITASQVTAAFGAGTQIYTFFENSADANNATVCFYKVAEGTIAANVPVLVKATAASTEQVFEGVQIVAPVADVKTGGTNFDFVGVYAPATLEKGDFFIGNGAIYKSTGETSIKAFRAYIDNKSGAAAARIVIDGEEVTAIDGMEMGGNRIGKAHNLQGMEVNTPQKGLYIVNGKKIVVK